MSFWQWVNLFPSKSFISTNATFICFKIQLKGQQKAIESLEINIKHMRDQLHHKRSFHPTTDDPLEVIKEEVHINKILAETKLPEELEACKKELELYTMVANEPEPSQEDLDILSQEVFNIEHGNFWNVIKHSGCRLKKWLKR